MKIKSILRPWKNSIKTKIGITLLFIIAGILGLFGIYQYLDMKSNITKELNELADMTIIRLAEQLILPLWEVDNLWVRKIVTSEMKDKRIHAILVSGEGHISEGKKRDSQHRLVDSGNDISGDFVIRSRDIIQDDAKIGSVKLYITKKFMINELKRETGTLLLTVILLSVFFIFFLSLMLHKIVIHPISLIRKYAVAIAKGDYGQDLVVSQQDEIGILARGFNRMKENIRQRERERDSAEEALRESEERFRSLVETTSDWVWEVDQNGAYTYVNPNVGELLGYDVDEVVGKTPFDFMPPGEAERIGATFEGIVAPQEPITNLENINVHKDGHLVYLETSGVPFFSPNGEFLGYRGIDRDITERKLAEEELKKHRDHLEDLVKERTNELEATQEELVKHERLAVLGQLTAMVSHELRNPLGVIRSSAYYLNNRSGNADEKTRKHLERIEQQVGHCDSIVDELLEYTRGRRSEMRKGALNPWLEGALDQIKIPDQVRLDYEPSPDIPMVRFDQEKMRRVVINLVENALQAVIARQEGLKKEDVPYEPRVKVSTSITDNGVCIGVEDNGIGMDDETARQAFEPLFTTRARGTGLGLAIVLKIVKEHGGSVSLNSELGRGTKATVVIPMKNREAIL